MYLSSSIKGFQLPEVASYPIVGLKVFFILHFCKESNCNILSKLMISVLKSFYEYKITSFLTIYWHNA